MKVIDAKLSVEKEALGKPWGFKGGFLQDIWQVRVELRSDKGQTSVGLGVQNVLWSDAEVFASYSEEDGNNLMLELTRNALELLPEIAFEHPIELLERLVEELRPKDKRLTFLLNALVGVDNAVWLLWAKENGISNFKGLIPEFAQAALSYRNAEVISVPAVGYTMGLEEVVCLVEEGYRCLKIKIGSEGEPETMLAWDKRRLLEIHQAVPNENVKFYLDANGRYDSKKRIWQLLQYIEEIGALRRTLLLEEPFPEFVKENVGDLPVRVVADESAHTELDVLERIELGYGAIALKPIAKTLSMSFKMAAVAKKHHIPCFCADLTVNPILVDWNKTFTAYLEPLPDFNAQIMENNGFQNYRDWERMRQSHPYANASWTQANNGVFVLNNDFYQCSGGIFAF